MLWLLDTDVSSIDQSSKSYLNKSPFVQPTMMLPFPSLMIFVGYELKSERLVSRTPSCENTLTKLSLPDVTMRSSDIIVIDVIAVLCATVASPVGTPSWNSFALRSPP